MTTPMVSSYRIRNWSRYQHYQNRCPPWIKLHYELLSSRDWVMLADASRVLAVASMLLASRNDGTVPADPDYVQRVAYLHEPPDFQPLVDIGFLVPLAHASTLQADASTLQADATKPPPRGEGETETEGEGEYAPPHAGGESVVYPDPETWYEYGRGINCAIPWSMEQAKAKWNELASIGWVTYKGHPIKSWKAYLQSEAEYIQGKLRGDAKSGELFA